MRRRFGYDFCQERSSKADLLRPRGKKQDTFFVRSSLDAARCSAGGRSLQFGGWSRKCAYKIHEIRTVLQGSEILCGMWSMNVTSLLWFLHPFWNCGIPPPLFWKIDSVLLKSFAKGFSGAWKLPVLSALGGLLQLVDQSVATSQQGIALCRPPGHHAGPSSSTGFCLVNNVAVAARYAIRKHPDSRK